MGNAGQFDVVIVGGGPAGISAAAWCSDLGLKALLVERANHLGGQLMQIHAGIKNYPGVETQDGEELRDRFLKSLSGASCDLRLSAEIRSVDLLNKTIKFGNSDEVSANALIIATGVRRRKLHIGGEEEFEGRGILTSGAKEKELVKGSKVVIVGGGDAALENALILSEYASHITIVHRRNEFSVRHEFVSEANTRSNIKFQLSNTVKSFFGDDRLTGVVLEPRDGNVSKIDASYVLIRIGVEPNTEIFRDELKMDSKGYIEISRYCETSCSGVYAIGDVAFPISPTIAGAVGSAATASKHILSMFEKMHERPTP